MEKKNTVLANELTEAEVNVYDKCPDKVKTHCYYDCLNQGAWITTDH